MYGGFDTQLMKCFDVSLISRRWPEQASRNLRPIKDSLRGSEVYNEKSPRSTKAKVVLFSFCPRSS